MEIRILILFGPKHNAAFPLPNDASDTKFNAFGPLVSEIFVFESMNARTPTSVLSYNLTL